MTWIKDPDDVHLDEGLREAGAQAALLWFVAMRVCARKDGDGVLSPLMIEDSANLYRLKATTASKALVEQGKWHDPAALEACEECLEHTPELPSPKHRLIHRWWDHLLRSDGKEDPIKRSRERRRKALNSPRCLPIRQAVRERDKDLCRYCGVTTIWDTADRRSPRVGEFDHKDPWGDNTVENLVVACKRCNGRKNQRSPEEAGMTLLAPGTTRADLARPGPRLGLARFDPAEPGSDQAEPSPTNPSDPATDLARARHAHETGTGQIGPGQTGPESGSGPDRAADAAGTDTGPGPAPVSAETDADREVSA